MKFKGNEDKTDSWSATILEKLDDLDKFRLSPMLEQVRVTNGRVSSLEKWRTYLTGAAAVFLVIVGSIGFWFRQYVHSLVLDEFSAYETRTNVNGE